MMGTAVWFVSELYYPEETSTGYFLTGLAEGLSGEYSTGAVCGEPTYSSRGVAVPHRENRRGVEIYRSRNSRLDPHRPLQRMANVATVSLSAFCILLRVLRRNDVVVVVTNPPTLPFLAVIAGRLRGARCVLLVHDVYPEILAAVGLLSSRSPLYRVLRWLTAWLYRSCDHVVVLGRDMKVVVERKLGREGKVTVIPNWGDVESIRPGKGLSAVRSRLGLEGKFVVQYSGNLGRTHDLESILGAAVALKTGGVVHFLIVGWGAGKGVVERSIAERGLTNVTLLPPVPREELCGSLNAADVAIVTLRVGMTGLSVPSRIYNLLAAGRPVIAVAEARTELALIVQEEGAGWVVAPGDVSSLVTVIEEARNSPARLREMSARGRAAAEARYSKREVITAYSRLLREVAAR